MNQLGIRAVLTPLALSAIFLTTAFPAETKSDRPGSRVFRFSYGARVNELPSGAHVRVWFPVPQSGKHQQVKLLSRDLPAESQDQVEPTFGNKITYFEMSAPPSGRLNFSSSYLIRRREVRGLVAHDKEGVLTDEQRKRFLSANAKVPLEGKPLRLIDGLDLSGNSLSIARKLYDQVDGHVRYDKSRPGYGNGDVLWVCDSRFGNCTDFHSLFISLARAQGLPARFEIGFPLPEQRGEGSIGGYHCWASFYVDGLGWVPVDISEADKHPEKKEYYFGNLTEDRVSLTIGRDLVLVPRQDAAPLNFFVYPHVEVDGQPWPKERIRLHVGYVDVEAAESQ